MRGALNHHETLPRTSLPRLYACRLSFPTRSDDVRTRHNGFKRFTVERERTTNSSFRPLSRRGGDPVQGSLCPSTSRSAPRLRQGVKGAAVGVW